METDWEMVHEIASEIFFTIESGETSAASFTFDDIAEAVPVTQPSPQTQTPKTPDSVAGGALNPEALNPFVGDHPEVVLVGDDFMKIEMTPVPFSSLDPWINAKDFTGADISTEATLLSPPNLKVPGVYDLEYAISDFRGLTSRINKKG